MMESDPKSTASPALVITGMHRSGTSLLASLLADAGVWIGDELVPATPGNPRGHFEDVEFFRLHQRMLAAAGLGQEGFTCQQGIAVPTTARAAAAQLVERRRRAGRIWGWKDPRTTLFLDVWAELIPEARFVFIVRPPWEVADSLFRRGDDAFALNPRLAVDVWVAYNRRIRDFVVGHRDRCAIVETTDLVADPTAFIARMATLLGSPLAQPAPRFEEDLLVTRHAPHRRVLVHSTQPEALDLLAELRLLAGAAATPAAAAANPDEVVDAALAEWATLAAATKALDARERSVAEQSAALTSATSALEEERMTGQRLAERAASLSRAVEDLTATLAAERDAADAMQTSHAQEIASLNSQFAAERAAASAMQTSHAQEIASLNSQFAAERAAATETCSGLREEIASLKSQFAADHATATETCSGLREEIAELKSRLADAESAVALQAARADAGIRRQEEARIATHDREVAQHREEAARLADQLQAEREIFESLRQDLVAQLDAALAATGTHAAADPDRQRRSLGSRLVAEGRRFARRVGGRSRRAA